MLLSNYCDEDVIRKSFINCRNEDPEAYFEHIVSDSTWFETKICECNLACPDIMVIFLD